MSGTPRLLAVLALAGAQLACTDEADKVEASAELEIFDTQLIGEPAPPEPEQETDVILLDPGAEPRRKLRYRIEPGTEQRVLVTSTLVQNFEMDGNPLSKQSAPPTHLEVVLLAKPADESGQQRFDVEFIQAQVVNYERMMVLRGDDLVSSLEGLRGKHLEIEVSDRGILDRQQLKAASSAEATIEGAQLAGLLGTFSGVVQTALPEEEIGVGARWRVADPTTDAPGGEATQELELVAVDGERIELVESTTFELGEGAMPTVRKMKLASSGSGRRVLELGRVAPLRYENTTTMSMSMEVREGQNVRQLDATIVMTLKEEGS